MARALLARAAWPRLAAAAGVFALVITLLLVRPWSHRPTSSIHSGQRRQRLVTPTTARAPVAEIVQGCVLQLPRTWTDAIQEVPTPAVGAVGASAGLTVLSMTPSGETIASSNVVDAHSDGALVLVRPNGATQVLYSVPAARIGHRLTQIESASTDGEWVVFDLVDSRGAPESIRAVNLRSKAVLEISRPPSGTEISDPHILHGTAYWGELQVNAPSDGHIYGYELRSARRMTVDSGAVVNPTVLGGALEWTRNGSSKWLGTPHLPAAYPVIPVKPYPLVQNGSAAAWTDWDDSGARPLPTVVVKTANDARARIAYRGSRAQDDASRQPKPFALISSYLVYSDGADLLALDLKTGAALRLAAFVPGIVRASAANGVLAMDTLGSKGGAHLALLHPAGLPEPHC